MKIKHLLLMFILLCTAMNNISAQSPSNQTVNKLREIYNASPKMEISFEKFIQINKHIYEPGKLRSFTSATLKINDCSSLHSVCGNGDFESGSIDPTEWRGGYGTWGAGQPNPFSLTEGIISGNINNSSAHQTVVNVGNDPVLGSALQQVAPDGGSHSLRIGNAVNGTGTEFVSKTVLVTADKAIFPFRYALVFEDPNHARADQPAFSVRAFTCDGTELPGICDLGNNSNIAISDAQDPFFQSANGGAIAYKDWSQAQINLSPYIGQIITIVFTNKDCALSGHFGYTYLDNLCTVCTSGCPYNVTPSSATSTCGKGQICVDYALPSTDRNTGDVVLELSMYQNGSLVQPPTSSPRLNSGTSYCFPVDPANVGNPALGGFDYVVTGRFSINGFPLSPVILGQIPEGQAAGQNNDYLNVATNAVCKNVSVTLVNGSASITAADIDGGSTGCGKLNLTASKTTFSCSDIGPNIVQLKATDANGGESTCDAIVTVIGEVPVCSITSIPANNTYTGGVPTNIYLGYGPQSTTLSVNVPASGAPYTFAWNGNGALSNTNTSNPVFAPGAPGTYNFTVTVTNRFGCSSKCSIQICVLDVTVPGSNGKKVYICHFPPGNNGNPQTISVSINAVSTHIFNPGHGDHLGTCDQVPCASGARMVSEQPVMTEQLGVTISPNPSAGTFNLKFSSTHNELLTVSIVDDLSGRLIETFRSISPATMLRVGAALKTGSYHILVTQGTEKASAKMIKIK